MSYEYRTFDPRLFFIICGVVAYCSYFREDKESSLEEPDGKDPRYANYIPMYVLPEFVLIILIGCTAYYGWEYSSELLLSWCFGTFTHISLFYLILLLFMPLLRKYFSARSCAELWMLPTLLYMAEHSFMSLPEPLLVITLPNGFIKNAIDPNEIPASILFTDIQSDKIAIEFSHSVYSDYTIEIWNWDRTELEFVNLDDYVADDTFMLAPYDAHYNVYASFQMEDGKVIDMVFKFDVELAE